VAAAARLTPLAPIAPNPSRGVWMLVFLQGAVELEARAILASTCVVGRRARPTARAGARALVEVRREVLGCDLGRWHLRVAVS